MNGTNNLAYILSVLCIVVFVLNVLPAFAPPTWVTMGLAAIGFLPPIAGALTQEVIDVAVILNALRALTSGHKLGHRKMPTDAARTLRDDHERMHRLRQLRLQRDEKSKANS